MTVAEKRAIVLKHVNAQKDILSRCERDIEAYRKGDMTLTFVDKSGKPVTPDMVHVTQKTHDFKYGANIFLLDEFENEWENAAYRDLFKKYFNLATVPFYWRDLEPTEGHPRFAKDSEKIYRRPAPDLCVEYCKESGILPKLHCLVYEAWVPTWVPRDDLAEVKRLYEKRIREIAERYRGTMYEFEVINECLISPKTALHDSEDAVEWAFATAKKYLPNETLVINDWSMSYELATEKRYSQYYLQLKALLSVGTPIDKIGIQHHMFTGANLPSPEDVTEELLQDEAKRNVNPTVTLEAMNMLSAFDRPLEITEVTFPTLGDDEDAEELQADMLEAMYTAWFACEKMQAVVYWNTVDGTAWNDTSRMWNENNVRGGLFHRDLTPKKSAERLYYLFNEKWHTDLSVDVRDGAASFRGFYGDYEVTVDGKSYPFTLHQGETEKAIVVG